MLSYEKLIYTNEQNQSIELSFLTGFNVDTFDGRNGLQNNLITEKGVNQIGSTFINNNIDNRNINLGGKIFDNVDANKDLLVKVFNPILNGTLKYINTKENIERTISCHVNKCVVATKSGLTSFVITMTATEPYFKEAEITKPLALTTNLFELPISIPDSGIEFGTVTNRTAHIFNNGDIKTPLIIEFVGVLTNPIVTNETTGEYVKVNTSLAEDEKLLIYTAYGNKKVLKVNADGEVTNAFGLIDLSSKFFDLQIGSNTITFDADSGADESTLFIHYNNQFLGV